MSKFYVVYGYCGPDNYTSEDGPILRVKEFDTAESVEQFHEKWVTELESDRDASHLTFRVFEGTERILVPVEKVIRYKLQN